MFIKRVAKRSPEIHIMHHLSDLRMRGDTRNRAVPLLDLLVGEEDHDFLVMPLLRHFDDPRFLYVEEVVDFVRQTLEVRNDPQISTGVILIRVQGLAFLHEVGVAHR